MINEIKTHHIIDAEVDSDCTSDGAINWIDIRIENSNGEGFRFTIFPEGGSDGTLHILEQIRDSASDAISRARGG